MGALWLRRQMTKWTKGDTFIVAAPNYKTFNQSTLPTFLRIFQGKGEYKKADQEFHLHSGPTGYFRTSTEPDSVEGIQNCRAIWGDEAGKFKYLFYVNLEGRAARTDAPIFLSTTPYARNFLYSDMIRPYDQGLRSDLAYYNWRSIDNPTFSKEEYERQRKLLDPIRFAMKYEGLFMKRVGLVFDLDDGYIISPEPLPSDTVYYAGVDWGFSDPMAIVIRGMTHDGLDIQVDEFYQSGVFPDQIPLIIQKYQEKWNIKLWLADGSNAGMVQMLQGKYPMVAADRTPGSLRKGIDSHNMLLRSGKHRIFKTCKHSIDEYSQYRWPDGDDDGIDAEDKPLDEFNHAMDAARYLSHYLKPMGNLETPRITHTEEKRAEIREYTHVPVWERTKRRDKDFGTL